MAVRSKDAKTILEELPEQLNAVAPGAAWLPMGDAIAALEAIGVQSADGRQWTEVVRDVYARAHGGDLSLGHMQKMRRVRNFVRDAAARLGIDADGRIASVPFSALEIADRMHSLDAARGDALFLACVNGRKRYVDVKRDYEDFLQTHARDLPKKRATWLKKREESGETFADARIIAKVLMSDPYLFTGRHTTVLLNAFDPAKVSPYLRATDFGYRVVSADDEQVLGIEVIQTQSLTRHTLSARLAGLEFQASFFDRYWVFLQGPDDPPATLLKALDELDVNRPGWIWLKADNDWEVIQRPEDHLPIVKRRNLVLARQR